MKFQDLIRKFKELQWKNYIYPFISVVFLLLAIFTFISTTKFLSKNLNKTFFVDQSAIQSKLVRVNFDNLYFVAKKLGIEIKTEEEAAEILPEAPPETPQPPAEEVEKPPEDKTLLKIQILNSVAVKGLAADLKTGLEEAGFVVEEIGNFSPAQQLTQIKIKTEKSADFGASLEELKQIVSTKYTLDQESQTLDGDSPYDVVIIIGK